MMQFAVLGFVISNKFTGFRRAVGSEFLDFRFLVLKCHFKKGVMSLTATRGRKNALLKIIKAAKTVKAGRA